MDKRMRHRPGAKAVLERHKLNPLCWVVVNETSHSLIVKQRITGKFRLISK